MFCTKCGATLASNPNFCAACGASVASGPTEDDPSHVAVSTDSHSIGQKNLNLGAGVCVCIAALLLMVAIHFRTVHRQQDDQRALLQVTEMIRGKDFDKAIVTLRPLAERGLPKAQYKLGQLYDHGDGVVKDEAQAAIWYRKAADQGDADAQTDLGFLYEHGEGVAADKTEATTWYRKAADQGDANAQFDLGIMYENGYGGVKDEAQAISWYRKAADQGNADAEFNLGASYYNGDGVAKDESQALSWFRKAADQGNANAQKALHKIQRPEQQAAPEQDGHRRAAVSELYFTSEVGCSSLRQVMLYWANAPGVSEGTWSKKFHDYYWAGHSSGCF